jgi:hypothetical protein
VWKSHRRSRRQNSPLIRIFFIRNERGIKFASFLILFFTFVVREGVRDYLKDRVTDINAALANQLTISQVSDLASNTANIEDTLSHVQIALEKSQPDISKDSNRSRIIGISHKSSEISGILESLRELGEVVHFDNVSIRKSADISGQNQNDVKQTMEMSIKNEVGEHVSLEEVLALDRSVIKNLAEALMYEGEMEKFAIAAKSKSERQLNEVTVTAFALYGFGALLSVFSLYFGIGELPTG